MVLLTWFLSIGTCAQSARELNNSAWQLMAINPDSGMGLVDQAMTMNLEHDSLRASVYRTKGVLYLYLGEYFSALNNFEIGIRLANKAGADTLESLTTMHMALAYMFLGEFDKSLIYFQEANKMAEAMGQTNQVYSTYGNMGLLYDRMGDTKLAKEYYTKAMVHHKAIGDSGNYAKNIANISSLLMNEDQLDSAISLMTESMNIQKILGQDYSYYLARGNLGLMYTNKEWYAKADTIFRDVLAYSRKAGDQAGILTMYFYMGDMFMDMGELDSAEYYMLKSEKFAEAVQHTHRLKNAYGKLEDIYEQKEDYRLALKYARLESELDNELTGEEMQQKVKFLEYEENKRKEEIEMQRLLNEQARIQSLQYKAVFLFILLVFLILLFVIQKWSSPRFTEGMIFFAFILLFEFILLLVDPYVEDLAQEQPIWVLSMNVLLALVIVPLHSIIERFFKRRAGLHKAKEDQTG